MLNVGIAGAWHVHAKDYFSQLKQSKRVSITALWDEDEGLGKPWAEERGLDFAADLDEFLFGRGLDAVVVTTPTASHKDVIGKAVAAGKHVFTEKVLAADSEEARLIADLIEKSNVSFAISFPLLSNPKILYAKKLLDEKALGTVTGARFRRSHSGVSDGWLPKRWFDVSKSCGGAMMDLGAHPAYILPFLFGAPKRVSSFMTSPYGTGSDENAIMLCEFEGGLIASGETAFVTYGVPDLLEIYGTEGSLFIHGDEVHIASKSLAASGIASGKPAKLPDALPSPVIRFIDAVEAGEKSPLNLGTKDALTLTRMIEAAYLSASGGVSVSF
ncbi:MAG: Gfo/Idh/MocA family oxidoreductase [Clostridiales bacterium]|nr:Gfo/Idh/MocA family oxidoreductase [Clostridiales bacterium]